MLTDGRTTDDGVTGILIAHLGAFGSGELINVIIVLNNDVKMINQLLPFCIYTYIYGPGYDERYLMVAIIKIRLMLQLQSIACLEHFLKI